MARAAGGQAERGWKGRCSQLAKLQSRGVSERDQSSGRFQLIRSRKAGDIRLLGNSSGHGPTHTVSKLRPAPRQIDGFRNFARRGLGETVNGP
jgi:hypothetical protein